MFIRRLYICAMVLCTGLSLQAAKKFSHVHGEFDINATHLLYVLRQACPTIYCEGRVYRLIQEQWGCKDGNSFADCRLETLRKKYGGMEGVWLRRCINAALQDQQSSFIDWKPYITNNFKDENGNTLFHILAQNCETLIDNDIYRLIVEIDGVLGSNATIPYSSKYALSDDSVVMKGSRYLDGTMISTLVRNNNEETPRDILTRQKLNKDFFSYTCASCKNLDKYLHILEQREKNSLNTMEYIRSGKS